MRRPSPTRPIVFVLLLALSFDATAAHPFPGGVVASADGAASRAGLEMLEQKGNAIDAAVAAAFTLAVVEPHHSGLGGGGFALVWDAKAKTARILDFREVAPAKATRDMFVRDGVAVAKLSTDGALSVGVPGAVRGYLELHRAYGKLPRAKVLAPAIRAAQDGFSATPKFHAVARARLACLREDPEATRIFLRRADDGAWEPPAVGTVLRQAELAATLKEIAARGEGDFYAGRTARAIAHAVSERGGVLTTDDLGAYRTRWREPLEGTYRGHRVLTMPPPSAGGLAVLQVLGVLEAAGPQGPSSREVQVLHTYVEAVRRAYVDRARFLGDPAFSEVPLARLLSKDHLAQMLSSIDEQAATRSTSLLPSVPAVPAKLDGGTKNTSHVSVIDREGNAVALTTTVNYLFGSCIVAAKTGVLLNDQMDDFAAQPMVPNTYGLVTGEANAVAPGKIPLSSMSPTLVFQRDDPDRVMLAVGSPGGSTIPTTVIQVISNVVDGSMDVARAVAFGRVHHQYLPDVLLVDRHGLEPATQRALEAKGHQVKRVDGWGDAEAVYVDAMTNVRYGGSDPRNEGLVAGQER